jgi:transposase InsO family protein
MRSLAKEIPVTFLCRYFGVSTSGYYSWCKGQATFRKEKHMLLAVEIQRLFILSKKTYGSPRIFQELLKKDHSCCENTVAKVMKELGLSGDRKKKFKTMKTESISGGPIADRVFRIEDFKVKRPNEIWAGDITYITLKDKFLYLSVVIDLFSRRVIGWSISETLEAKGVSDALVMAIKREGNHENLIFHSDRGRQYSSSEFREILEAKYIIPSMSRKGNCYDNAFVETFFKSLKSELIYRNSYDCDRDLRNAIFEYIEIWYNKKRIHSSLGYLSPVEYETVNKMAA